MNVKKSSQINQLLWTIRSFVAITVLKANIHLANAAGIENPLGSTDSIQKFIIAIIRFLLGLSALLAFAAIIYGGIRLVASFGSEQNVQTGKNVIKWAVIGIVVIILSYTLLATVTRLLGV